jgi:hypothetical protein
LKVYIFCAVNIVTWCLEAGIVEREETATARQQIGKHVVMAVNEHSTTEELLEAVFSTQSLPGLYSKDWDRKLVVSQYSQLLVSWEHRRRGISIVRSRYLTTTSEDNKLRRLSMQCSDFVVCVDQWECYNHSYLWVISVHKIQLCDISES